MPPGLVAGTNADIRPVKGPIDIPSGWAWLGWTIGLVALAALAWLAWRRFLKARAKPKPKIVIPPHRKAKDRLRAAAELMSDPYRYCSLVSDVIRTYLEERFELHAPDRTTEEFLDELRTSNSLSEPQKESLEAFLNQCDMVKFARYEPTEPELRALLDSAMRLIEETEPANTDLGPSPSASGSNNAGGG